MGLGNYQGFNTAINRDLDLRPFSWAVGLGFRNLLLPGTVAGIAIGQPFVTNGLGNATQTNFETFYNLTINDNVSVTPTLSMMTNANNDSFNGTIWQGYIQNGVFVLNLERGNGQWARGKGQGARVRRENRMLSYF